MTTVMFLLCACLLIVSSLDWHHNSRSSLLHLIDGKTLIGHELRRHRCYDLMACAQSCLSLFGCVSFNYENQVDGNCELKNKRANIIGTGVKLIPSPGFIFGQLMNTSNDVVKDSNNNSAKPVYTFTTLGAHGHLGPTSTAQYMGTLLEGAVTLHNGIQQWVIPKTGNYVIKVLGASGANGACTEPQCSGFTLGGLGASITGTFIFKKGDILKILVGQEGERVSGFSKMPGSGGGGTFVTRSNNSPLIIAGGGGGGGAAQPGFGNGDPGQSSENGTRYGGSGGMGGELSDVRIVYAGSGAGLSSDGSRPITGISNPAKSFKQGGTGGINDIPRNHGGFGGGGFAWLHPGGGGGYSGGGVFGNKTSGFAGGGGSYNGGSNQKNTEGFNKGDGRVVIRML